MCTHSNCLTGAILVNTLHSTYHYYIEDRKISPNYIHLPRDPVLWLNPQWLELPISRTNLHGPKDVRVIEVRLYIYIVQSAVHLHYKNTPIQIY